MKEFKRNFEKVLYAAWLGGSLSLAGMSATTWQFWVVLLPTCLLVTVFNDGKFDLE